MSILVLNSGSSSLKFQLFNISLDEPVVLVRGAIRNYGPQASMEWWQQDRSETIDIAAATVADAVRHLLAQLLHRRAFDPRIRDQITAIGIRVVHGGERFYAPTLVNETLFSALQDMNALAPLHNPQALSLMRSCQSHFPQIPIVAVFDTAFFHDLPTHVHSYALPKQWSQPGTSIRRYGFHGLAHRSMTEQFLTMWDKDPQICRIISFQLGHGCSVAATCGGIPLETSMGFTPLEGLIMGTRAGDLDPGVLLHLLQSRQLTLAELADGLNHRSGLLGLSGISADMKVLLELEASGDTDAQLAVRAFCHRARKYLGAYLAVLGGADAILFGGGIGEQCAQIRARICDDMKWCGLVIDDTANRTAMSAPACISCDNSELQIHVLAVDEEYLIAQDTIGCLRTAQMKAFT